MPKKLTNSSFTRLWSMMDVETGCLLHQQMLTHETQDDVLPMMWSYAQRCTELGRPLPLGCAVIVASWTPASSTTRAPS